MVIRLNVKVPKVYLIYMYLLLGLRFPEIDLIDDGILAAAVEFM